MMINRGAGAADVLRDGADHATANAHNDASLDRPCHTRQPPNEDTMLKRMLDQLWRLARMFRRHPSRRAVAAAGDPATAAVANPIAASRLNRSRIVRGPLGTHVISPSQAGARHIFPSLATGADAIDMSRTGNRISVAATPPSRNSASPRVRSFPRGRSYALLVTE
jgi:hypothetical protein